jgi:hypothetical protein
MSASWPTVDGLAVGLRHSVDPACAAGVEPLAEAVAHDVDGRVERRRSAISTFV